MLHLRHRRMLIGDLQFRSVQAVATVLFWPRTETPALWGAGRKTARCVPGDRVSNARGDVRRRGCEESPWPRRLQRLLRHGRDLDGAGHATFGRFATRDNEANLAPNARRFELRLDRSVERIKRAPEEPSAETALHSILRVLPSSRQHIDTWPLG